MFEPPSEAPGMSLGVWISIKFQLYKYSLNSQQIPDCNLKIACFAGVRKSMILLSSLVLIDTDEVCCSFCSSATTGAVSEVAEVVYSLSQSSLSCCLEASSIQKGNLARDLDTTQIFSTISSSLEEVLLISVSGFWMTPQMSTIDSKGILPTHFTIVLEITSVLEIIAWIVENCYRRTMNPTLPLTLALWILARNSTVLPMRLSSMSKIQQGKTKKTNMKSVYN